MQGEGKGGFQYKGVFDVANHLYRESGVRSVGVALLRLLRATGLIAQRTSCAWACVRSISWQKPRRYFVAYAVMKKLLTPAGQSPSDLNPGAIIVAGGTGGVAMWDKRCVMSWIHMSLRSMFKAYVSMSPPLPQFLAQCKASARASTSNLQAKTIRWDGALFVPEHLIKP